MLPSDKPRFLAILNGLAAVKPNAKLTAEGCEVWWLAMREWAFSDFRDAAVHLTKSCQFMPTPYDFEKLKTAGRPTAHEAWTRVLSGAQLEPGSVTERAANAMGGQQRIRMADIERDLPHIQRRFIEAYEGLTDAEAIREAVPQIANQPNWLTGTVRSLEASRAVVGYQRRSGEGLDAGAVAAGGSGRELGGG